MERMGQVMEPAGTDELLLELGTVMDLTMDLWNALVNIVENRYIELKL